MSAEGLLYNCYQLYNAEYTSQNSYTFIAYKIVVHT